MFFPMFFAILFLVNDQLLSVKSTDENDYHMIEKRLQSLALLRGNLFRAKDLQNYVGNKRKDGQNWLNNSPWNTLNTGNDYFQCCLMYE